MKLGALYPQTDGSTYYSYDCSGGGSVIIHEYNGDVLSASAGAEGITIADITAALTHHQTSYERP